MKLDKETVDEYLRLKELVEARAKEVCEEHFMKTHYTVRPNNSRYFGFSSFDEVTNIGISVHDKDEEQIIYRFEDHQETDWDSVPLRCLWEDINFYDFRSKDNERIIRENTEREAAANLEQENKEKAELERLKAKYESD